LTFRPVHPTTSIKVSEFLSSVYAGWRTSASPLVSFHEDGNEPPEGLLQAIWWHQRLRRDELRLIDGRRLRVLHPGFWNREAGPDFRSAVLQFENNEPIRGDVEVDLQSRGWRDHRHHVNPDYKNVILHVVWIPQEATQLPSLPLMGFLDAPLAELAMWVSCESTSDFPPELKGHCCAPLQILSGSCVGSLLRQAAAIRFQAKGRRIQARARQVGWEQALWEGIFRALGYKHNVWPMQHLGEVRDRVCGPGAEPQDLVKLQATLIGVAGLLPKDLPRGSSAQATYVRRLWDIWWRQRGELDDIALPRSLWKLSGLRPSNRPERRLALAAHWLNSGTLPTALEKWCSETIAHKDLVSSLREVTRVPEDPFWCSHWNLSGPRLRRSQPLLGAARLTDIAANVVLPWLWVRAMEGKATALQEEMEKRYFAWPASEDNAVLRLARRRLLGKDSLAAFRSAAAQQGLIQIVRDFCENSDSLCAGCRFPELVRQWQPVPTK
jgi:hypothetical protein